jgi:hypothetical protein
MKASRFVRVLTYVSSVASAGLLFVTALKWSLVDWITVFGIVPLESGLWLLLVLCAAAGLVCAAFARRLGRSATYPLVICVSAALLASCFPFTRIWIGTNYRWYRSERERVVQQVQSGELRPNDDYNSELITLPASTPKVSMGGNQIVVETHDGQLYVFFFTFRGILSHYSGFLYVSSGGDPRRFGDLGDLPSHTVELVEREEHWYFVSHR